MHLRPTRFDFWFNSGLAKLLGRYPVLDRGVQSAIGHNVLGGVAYAAVLFLFWIEGARSEKRCVRVRVLTTILGTALAAAFTVVAGRIVSWPPPANHPRLAHLYQSHFDQNLNTNSFPSQSTAVYATVAAGVTSLSRPLGAALWAGLVILIAAPRLYVGGHYPSDVLGGLVLGSLGYYIARYLLEKLVTRPAYLICGKAKYGRTLCDLVVFWCILQIAVEFRDAVWIRNCVEYLMR